MKIVLKERNSMIHFSIQTWETDMGKWNKQSQGKRPDTSERHMNALSPRLRNLNFIHQAMERC